MSEAKPRKPLRLPELHKWHYYALAGMAALFIAFQWGPGLWMETFYRRPSTEWAEAVGKERLPSELRLGAVDFQITKVEILRVEPGIANVNLAGTAKLRESLYVPTYWRNALTDAGANFSDYDAAQNHARYLKWPTGTTPPQPVLVNFPFLKETTPAGTTATFNFSFQSERVGTRWQVKRIIDANTSPADTFVGSTKARIPGDNPIVLNSEEGKKRIAIMIDEMQNYVAVIETERKTEPGYSSQIQNNAFGATGALISPVIATGFSVPRSTISPNGQYGVIAPDWEHYANNSVPQNQLIEIASGRVLMTLNDITWVEINPSSPDKRHISNLTLDAHWSVDGSILSWALGGKWCPNAFSLICVKNGSVLWQLDVLKVVQDEILSRTKNEVPQNYEAARQQNRGNGSAFPDGFTVDVEFPQRSFSLPLQCHVTLSSNPKQISNWPPAANINATMLAMINANGQISYSNFSLETPKSQNNANGGYIPSPSFGSIQSSAIGSQNRNNNPFQTGTASESVASAEQRLNVVYQQLRQQLDDRQKNRLKQDEVQWIKQKDNIPITDPRHLEMIELRIQQLQNWR